MRTSSRNPWMPPTSFLVTNSRRSVRKERQEEERQEEESHEEVTIAAMMKNVMAPHTAIRISSCGSSVSSAPPPPPCPHP
eukprot:765660-Hanusia_phi.AAC.3